MAPLSNRVCIAQLCDTEGAKIKRHAARFGVHWVWDMPTRSSTGRDHDFATIARHVVEQTIGEKLNGEALDDPNAGKNPHAVALGRLGGQRGGKARAAALTATRRKAIAKKAAQARWSAKPIDSHGS